MGTKNPEVGRYYLLFGEAAKITAVSSDSSWVGFETYDDLGVIESTGESLASFLDPLILH